MIKGKKCLELFNQKAERLERFSFLKDLLANPDVIRLQTGETEWSLSTKFPDEETTDAFILTFRQFIQKNDPISFANMAIEYEALPLSQETKARFAAIRASFNQYLDSEVEEVSMAEQDGASGEVTAFKLVRRHVMETFIYGHFAHSDQKYRPIFEHWRQEPFTFAILTALFNNILASVVFHILAVKQLNERALSELA